MASQPVQGTAQRIEQIWSLTTGGLLTKVNCNENLASGVYKGGLLAQVVLRTGSTVPEKKRR